MRPQDWPSSRDYCEAMRDPNSLADRELREGTLECNPGGLPKSYTGTFTTTFHFRTASGDVALRCYVRGYDDLARRYSAIGDVLRYARIDGLCKTQYLPEAVCVRGVWWPAVKMDWVGGRALNAEVEARLDDPDGMLAVAMQFRETVRSLGVLGIAHGDLQPANIVVTSGELRLVDYDAMFVPAIAGLPQTEYGHRNFQHPERRTARFDGRLDRFSSIVIYTALVALCADRTLWARFNDGENLLFRAHDFTSNGQSELFRTLLASNATSGLAEVLLAACERPVEDVPTLEHAITAATGTMPALSFSPHREAPALGPLKSRPGPPPRSPAYGRAERPFMPPPPSQPPRSPAFVATPSISRQFPGRTGIVLTVTALAGLGIGFALAAWPHGAARRAVATKHATVAYAQPATKPLHTAVATAKLTAAPTPTLTPTAVPSAVVTPAKGANAAALQGPWQIAEANLQDGTMVWSGGAVVASDGTIVLDAHKDSIAGRAASQCERQTDLHAAFAPGVSQQTVPFVETNCQGATSSGEVRVKRFSPDGRSFNGSFWQGGTKLGDFTASKQ